MILSDFGYSVQYTTSDIGDFILYWLFCSVYYLRHRWFYLILAILFSILPQTLVTLSYIDYSVQYTTSDIGDLIWFWLFRSVYYLRHRWLIIIWLFCGVYYLRFQWLYLILAILFSILPHTSVTLSDVGYSVQYTTSDIGHFIRFWLFCSVYYLRHWWLYLILTILFSILPQT